MALLSSGPSTTLAVDLDSLCADRMAIERVYYNHRIGEKPPFKQALPAPTLEGLVRRDARKEAALKRAYGVDITPAMLEAEVQRIATTTRAPEMLAEIKAALGNDPLRFANAFAKPFLVERLLRERFENDDTLHAAQRSEMETVREELLARRNNGESAANIVGLLKDGYANQVSETTWQLGARPAETSTQGNPAEQEIKERFGPDAQLLSSPHGGDEDRTLYFDDMPRELQEVLRAQLRQAGDISAVIETPAGFLLYLARVKTREVLSVTTLSLPKRDYHDWLSE